MARKAFLLRIDPAVLTAVQKWAEDDLRSLNGQIEYLLREVAVQRGRSPRRGRDEGTGSTKGRTR